MANCYRNLLPDSFRVCITFIAAAGKSFGLRGSNNLGASLVTRCPVFWAPGEHSGGSIFNSSLALLLILRGGSVVVSGYLRDPSAICRCRPWLAFISPQAVAKFCRSRIASWDRLGFLFNA